MIHGVLKHDDRPVGPARLDPHRLARLTPIRRPRVRLHPASGPPRDEVEAYIDSAYRRAFGGRISHHYPTLMSVRNADGAIVAAAGYRLAATEALFLETYLDEPVESVLAGRFKAPVSRHQVAEVGNLASDCRGASLFLFLALGRRLQRTGCVYAVATATASLRRSFARLGFSTTALALAEAGKLEAGAAEWGTYYEHAPEVRAGLIDWALRPLAGALETRTGAASTTAVLS